MSLRGHEVWPPSLALYEFVGRLFPHKSQRNQLESLTKRNRPMWLALSISLPHAGDVVNVVPSPALGLCQLDQEFHFYLNYWFGVRMTEGPNCMHVGKHQQ